MGFLEYLGGGGGGSRWFGLVSERGSRGGAEGQMRGQREVIDDDDRGRI